MSTTFARTINNNPIYSARADADAAGNDIAQTYATKSELPSGVPAVTSSDDSKVLKATYSGGVGSYAWETESGGTTYIAGNGIAIDNNEISVDYDSNTLDTVAGTVTITAASTPGDYIPYMPINDAGFTSLLNGQTSTDVTVHIPEGFFTSSMLLGTQGYSVFLALYTDYPGYGGTGSPAVYTYAPLTYQYDSFNDEYTIDEQDVVLRLPASGERWYPGTSLTFTNPYIVIVIAMDPSMGTSTPADDIAAEDSYCTITYPSAASQVLAVKNPLPSSAVGDSGKVLTVNSSGAPVWATAPATQVNSDWEATSGVSEILNKPDLVDIVAGPGIVVDNPDGNTLRVSQYDPTVDVVRDCENWNGHTMKCIILRGAYTTNTSMQNQYIENVLPVGTTIAFIDGSNSYVVYGGNPQINMMVPYCIDNNRLFSPWVDITNRRVNLRYIDISNNITCTYYLCVKYAVD